TCPGPPRFGSKIAPSLVGEADPWREERKKILLAATVAVRGRMEVFEVVFLARTIPKALPQFPPPFFNWPVFYFGGFVGGAFGGSNGVSEGLPGSVISSRSDSAFFGGGQVGYNWQFAPNWVIGIEGDIGGLSNSGRTVTDTTFGGVVRDRSDWLA